MLDLKNICLTFSKGTVDEKPLFKDFNLTVKEGDFVSVVGSNGSGKTTILNVISGDMKVDSGHIFLRDKDITNVPSYKRSRSIARVFQDPQSGTCSTMTIFENMSIADNKLKPFGLTPGLNKKRKDFYRSQLELLGLGLENRMDAVVGTLSGGQRQALALIMATMVTPELLLLDEHTAALDPKSSDTVMSLTLKIIEEKKLTALMVTHNLRHAVNYGTRALMMHDGAAVLDIDGQQKKDLKIDDILDIFNEISIECGN